MRSGAMLLAVAAIGAALAAGEEVAPPELPLRHVHPSGLFTFRTPQDWKTAVSPTDPDAIETGDGELLVRFLVERRGHGFDALHVSCMLIRLAPDMQQHPQVKYEHDFLSGRSGDVRFLDSAFVVTYDEEIGGYQKWRQRNVTAVAEGVSLCAISYAPEPVWKKSEEKRALLDAVLGSVEFLEAPAQ